MSKGEDKIVNLLNQAKIKYEKEKTFSDLKHGKFRFDFLVHTPCVDCIIEFNGE